MGALVRTQRNLNFRNDQPNAASIKNLEAASGSGATVGIMYPGYLTDRSNERKSRVG